MSILNKKFIIVATVMVLVWDPEIVLLSQFYSPRQVAAREASVEVYVVRALLVFYL